LRPDLAVVAAYGKILPPALIDAPRLGTINVHASLLPRWRGAAPVHRAVLAGDARTGVTIMRVVEKLDAGPILAVRETPIGPNETSDELEERLAGIGAALLVEVADLVAEGRIRERPQDEAHATYAARLERRESEIDWARPAGFVHNQIRGLRPWPLAAGRLLGKRTLLLRSEVAHEQPTGAAPGTIVAVAPDALEVAASPGVLRLREIQAAGGRPMDAGSFVRGHRVRPGMRFEPLAPADS
jgi:methionyl-tRNA formyltransferase